VLFDDNTVGMAAISDTSKVHVWRVVGESHVWSELLETGLAVATVAVGVNQTANCSKVAWLELGDCGADLGDTTDDLMSGNAWIDSGHPAPLVTDLVQVRVADTTEKYFDLNVVLARITPGDHRWCNWRARTGSRVSLRFILTT
jgi:hypothetical protein